MPRLCANLSFLFTELPFHERFAAAAEAGFKGVEFLFPYDYDPADLARLARANALEVVLFNIYPGDWEGGWRGLAGIPGREAEFRDRLREALDYARALGCQRLHAMAGLEGHGADAATLVANLKAAAPLAAEAGVTLLIEPINSRDMPGFLVRRTGQALDILRRVGAENVRLQLDLYHRHMEEGDPAAAVEQASSRLGHVQIAGPPDRGEPIPSELEDVTGLFSRLDQLGYDGWVGCEYRPRGGTDAGLGWRESAGVR